MADITMYTTTWCGYCVRLKRQMESAGITFDEVNIEQVAAPPKWWSRQMGATRPSPPWCSPTAPP